MKKILISIFLIFLPLVVAAKPIYVYTEADGTKRFTDKKPPTSFKASIYTAKAKFSRYSGRRGFGSRITRRIGKHNSFDNIIDSASARYGLGTDLIKAVIHVESAFNPQAVSPKGAQGLMQLMPFNSKKYGVTNPYSPNQNINAGTKMLSKLLNKYSGNLRYALAAYNAGEGAVKKYKGIPPYPETQNYVKKVIKLKALY